MPNLVLRGIPEQLHSELKAAAARNHRSLNGEILARLTASSRSQPVDPATLLARIRARHKTIGRADLSEENLRKLKDAGRP